MARIGTFTFSNDTFTGTVTTLALTAKVRIVPNDKRSEDSPDYRVLTANGYELGAAWARIARGSERAYLSVVLDDPSLAHQIWARLIESADRPGEHDLLWSRARRAD